MVRVEEYLLLNIFLTSVNGESLSSTSVNGEYRLYTKDVKSKSVQGTTELCRGILREVL